MQIEVSNRLYIKNPTPDVLDTLMRASTIKNPAYKNYLEQTRRMKKWPWVKEHNKWIIPERNKNKIKIPEYLRFWKFHKDQQTYSFPRGLAEHQYLDGLDKEMKTSEPYAEIHSNELRKKLRPYQNIARKSLLENVTGLLSIPTGGGKTFTALASLPPLRTLIIVDKKILLDQWVDEISKALLIRKKDIGVLGGGKRRLGQQITVAIVNTLKNIIAEDTEGELRDYFGCVITDEAHIIPMASATECVDYFNALYKYGLSATLYRRDPEEDKVIRMFLGPVRYEIKPEQLMDKGYILRPKVREIPTNFRFKQSYKCRKCGSEIISERWVKTCPKCQGEVKQATLFSDVIQRLTEDEKRNDLILEHLDRCFIRTTERAVRLDEEVNDIYLVLADRVEHLERLAEKYKKNYCNRNEDSVAVLHGGLKKSDRDYITKGLGNGDISVLFSTTSLIGKGFNLPAISKLFLATPMRYKGRLIQAVGRILRTAPGKSRPEIFDFVDINVGVLVSQWTERKRAYDEINAELPKAA